MVLYLHCVDAFLAILTAYTHFTQVYVAGSSEFSLLLLNQTLFPFKLKIVFVLYTYVSCRQQCKALSWKHNHAFWLVLLSRHKHLA